MDYPHPNVRYSIWSITIIQQLVNITLSGDVHFGFRRYLGLQVEHFVVHLKNVFFVCVSI